MRKSMLAAGAVLAFAALAAAQSTGSQAWVHIQVVEQGDRGTRVNVNLPLSIAQKALALAPSDVVGEGRLDIGTKGTGRATLRELWTQLKASPDAEFVTVEEKDQTVRMEKRAGRLLISVDGRGPRAEKVRVNLAASVVDALLSGDGSSLNVQAALGQLTEERGELITVMDGSSTVKIWVDEKG